MKARAVNCSPEFGSRQAKSTKKNGETMGERKEKRRGGQRDDSEVHISYSRGRLMQLIVDTERKLGVKHDHDFKYHFKKYVAIN